MVNEVCLEERWVDVFGKLLARRSNISTGVSACRSSNVAKVCAKIRDVSGGRVPAKDGCSDETFDASVQ